VTRRIADIVGDEQSAPAIDRDAGRTAGEVFGGRHLSGPIRYVDWSHRGHIGAHRPDNI
jgi:hypothetical protein